MYCEAGAGKHFSPGETDEMILRMFVRVFVCVCVDHMHTCAHTCICIPLVGAMQTREDDFLALAQASQPASASTMNVANGNRNQT